MKVDVTNRNRDIFVLLYDLLNSTRGGWLQSRINWRRQNGVTKHEAVCTCSRTTQCLFRMDSMEHIWNYLHFPCFSQTKIMLMLNLRFVTKAVPQTVCSYILIHMTCHRRTTADKHQYSTLSSHHDLYSRALLNCWQNFLRPSSKTFSRVTRCGTVFTNLQSRLLFPGHKVTRQKNWSSHFLIGGMEMS